MNSRTPWFVFAGALALLLLLIGVGGLALVSRAYSQSYVDRVYPGVNVYGVDLGGMTVDEATAALQSAFPDPATQPLMLRDGERTWGCTWADLGIKLDPAATAHMAYQAGRQGTLEEQRAAQLKAFFGGWPLAPVIILPNSTQATAALEALAPAIAVPPVDASLIIKPEGVVPVPAQAGRELDVEATVAAFPHALSVGPDGLVLNLLTRQVKPAIGNPGQVQVQAETLLARPFILTAYDFLTGFSATWSAEPATVAGWLIARPVEDEKGARLVLETQEDAIRAYLDALNSQLTTDKGTVPEIQAAIAATQSQAAVEMAHPPRTYVVQPGDTLMSVARAHGFPAWRLTEANPDIDINALRPGQEITIPSIDLLFPLPLITEQRIVIDISDLRLYAYEGETLVYDFPCSTGIDSSPTLPGTFQILSKEEEAYASSWDLWMPHFMGVYHSGPDFTNGIHGLPTRSGNIVVWESSLGVERVSFGCIVIGLEEAAKLYEWAPLGTLVIIQE
jgi:lipoprotein-anchoring transpeptidase ErfK/SrfK